VLIVGDDEAMRESIRAILETDPTLRVAGSADGATSAITVGRSTQPDVAVIDVDMPGGEGWAAVQGLRTVCPCIRVVAHSSCDGAPVTRALSVAGVSAYVTEGSDIALLLAAVHGRQATFEPPRVTWQVEMATAVAVG
jgi:DNA-binding NarL/FixJ family response regulator